MDKMKRVFSLVLVLAMLVGSFSSFSTIAFAEEAKKEEVKVEEKKEETKEEVKEEVKKEEVKVDDTKVLSNVPKDVIGTDYEEAVTRLVAFGVIGGYPDGTYKPEEEINRAQFAKIMVMALGLNDAVPAAQNQATGFKDVQAGYWAAGYINVASGQGLLKGYPDGTFRPANKVSYAESLTMLVRSLGYQDEFLPGNWPGNYVAKAADVKITSGVAMPADAKTGAKRGPVAQLVDNTLDAKVVKVDKYKPNTKEVEYYETKTTLLKEKLEISKHENTRIFADKIVDDSLSKDEVSVRFLQDTREKEEVRKAYKENDKEDFRTEINVRPFIGEEVTTYLTEKDRVVFVETEKDDRANFDFVQEIKDKDKASLVAFDKEYRFDDNADVYVFDSSNKEYKSYLGKDLKDKEIEEMLGRNGKFVVKNNKIVYAEVQQSEEALPWLLVLEKDGEVLKGVNKDSSDFKLDLAKDKTYDYTLVYDTKGNKIEVKDIEKGNLVYAQLQDYDGDDVAVVTVVKNNEVKGTVGAYKDDRVEIANKEYKAIKVKDSNTKFNTYYTVSDLDDIKLWDSKDNQVEFEKDFDDAYKEEMTAYLDATGRVAFLTASVDSTSGYKYGVVTRTYADGDRVRIFASIDGKEGKDQIFKADKESNITSPKVIEFKDGKFTKPEAKKYNVLGQAVKFRLNKDGEISKDEFYVMDKDALFVMQDGKDFGKDSMRLSTAKITGTDVNAKPAVGTDASFSVSNSLNIISAEGLNNFDDGFKDNGKYGDVETIQTTPKSVDIDDFDMAKWEDIKEDKYDAKLRMYVFPKGSKDNEADAVIFIGSEGANTSSDYFATYVVKARRADGDTVIRKMDTYGEGVNSKDVVVEDNTSVSEERAYIGRKKANNKIALFGTDNAKKVEKDEFTLYRGAYVKEVTGSKIVVNLPGESKDTTFVMKNNVVTYKDDVTSNVKVKDKIDIIVEDSVNVRVISVEERDSKPGETTEEGKLPSGQYKYLGLTNDGKIILEDSDGKAVEMATTSAVNTNGINPGDAVKIEVRTIGKTDYVVSIKSVEALNKAEKDLADAIKAEAKAEADKVKAQADLETANKAIAKADEDLIAASALVVGTGEGEVTQEVKNAKVAVATADKASADAAKVKAEADIAKADTDIAKAKADKATAQAEIDKLK